MAGKQYKLVFTGTMGAGIAYACLAAGFAVRLLDKDEAGLGRGIATVEKLFEGGLVIYPDAIFLGEDRFSSAAELADRLPAWLSTLKFDEERIWD